MPVLQLEWAKVLEGNLVSPGDAASDKSDPWAALYDCLLTAGSMDMESAALITTAAGIPVLSIPISSAHLGGTKAAVHSAAPDTHTDTSGPAAADVTQLVKHLLAAVQAASELLFHIGRLLTASRVPARLESRAPATGAWHAAMSSAADAGIPAAAGAELVLIAQGVNTSACSLLGVAAEKSVPLPGAADHQSSCKGAAQFEAALDACAAWRVGFPIDWQCTEETSALAACALLRGVLPLAAALGTCAGSVQCGGWGACAVSMAMDAGSAPETRQCPASAQHASEAVCADVLRLYATHQDKSAAVQQGVPLYGAAQQQGGPATQKEPASERLGPAMLFDADETESEDDELGLAAA